MSARFNASMLLLARQYRGKTQRQSAAEAGVSHGYYSRIENGLFPNGPSEKCIRDLARSLSFPIEFFFLEDRITGLPLSIHPMHRKKSTLTGSAIRRTNAELNLRLIHLRRLMHAVDIEPDLTLPAIDVEYGGGPEAIARTVRRTWGIPDGPVRNLTKFCERAGIYVFWCEFPLSLDGVTMRDPHLGSCVFLNRRAPADRMRATLAHELGHIVMHAFPTDEMENEANEFGAELLVPARELYVQVSGHRVTIPLLAGLKAYWRTSMQFLLFRTRKLGLINKNQYVYLWKQFSRNGWRTREPAETEFEHESPSLFENVIRLHTNELRYGPEDLCKLLYLHKHDLYHLYSNYVSISGREHLQLVYPEPASGPF